MIPSNAIVTPLFFLRIIGGLLFLVGFLLIYLTVLGNNLYYTQTYNNLSEFLPKIADTDILMICIVLTALLALEATKGFINFFPFSIHPRLRKLFGGLGLILCLGIVVFVVWAPSSGIPFAVNLVQSEWFLLMISIGSLGLLFFIYANAPPAVIHTGEVNPWVRAGCLMLAVIFAIMTVAAVEVRFTHPPITQNVLSSPITSPKRPPTHSVSAVLIDPPNRLAQGENAGLELRFRLTKYDPNETSLRFPINLDPGTEYGVLVHLRSVWFEISHMPEYVEKPQKIKADELKTWNWIIAPKADTYGTTQKLAIDLFLVDMREDRVVFQSPVTSIYIKVGAPLNVPKWLLTPSIGIGTIFVGAISFLLPWVLSHFEIRQQDK